MSSGDITVARAGELGSRNGANVGLPVETANVDIATQPFYFLHQFAPPSWIAPSTLSVVFVIDRSGSMSGQKMVQAIAALQTIVGSLRSSDRFGIVSFSGDMTPFRDEMVFASASEVAAAKSWAGGISAGGGTNISGAMSAAGRIISTRKPLANGSPDTAVVVLLTDGEPRYVCSKDAINVLFSTFCFDCFQHFVLKVAQIACGNAQCWHSRSNSIAISRQRACGDRRLCCQRSWFWTSTCFFLFLFARFPS